MTATAHTEETLPDVISGADIRKRRQTLGLTLEGLSNGICSTAYLSLIEQGHRQASPRIAELLVARLRAKAGESGIAIQIAALRLAEWQVRQSSGIEPDVRTSPALKNHQKFLDALESEARSETGTALAQLDNWLANQQNSRDLISFGGRVRVRLLRELGLDGEALRYASELLTAAQQQIKTRQDDLLEIAFQTAEMYSAAGAWRDALRVIESHRSLISEPRQQGNAHWAASNAYYAKGDFENALLEVRSALEAISTLDLPIGQAKLENNIVWHELHLGIVDEARQTEALDKAEAVLREHSDASTLAWLYCSRALLRAELGDISTFRTLANQAITMSINTQTRGHDELVLALAEIAAGHNDSDSALELLNRFDGRTRTVNQTRGEAALLVRAGKIAQKLGDFERAFGYADQSHTALGFAR